MRIVVNVLRCQGLLVEVLRENWGELLEQDARKINLSRKR